MVTWRWLPDPVTVYSASLNVIVASEVLGLLVGLVEEQRRVALQGLGLVRVEPADDRGEVERR